MENDSSAYAALVTLYNIAYNIPVLVTTIQGKTSEKCDENNKGMEAKSY